MPTETGTRPALRDRTGISPSVTLAEIHGPRHLFSPRAHPDAATWLLHGDMALDSLTGGQLTTLGDMPVLCSAAVATREALDLLAEAELPTPQRILAFRGRNDYQRKQRRMADQGWRIVNNHWHPPGVLPAACYANPQPLLTFLNNKANLARLVAAAYRPRRRQRAPHRLPGVSAPMLPIVVKAITEESTGGGSDVMICRRAGDLTRAADYFSHCRRVIVEEWLPMRRSFCLNYAAMSDGSLRYLGAAEQVCSREGRYLGNWLDTRRSPPPGAMAAGRSVAHRIVASGYRGLFGMDVAVLPDGLVRIFDLNIRANGCTTAILLDAAARRRHGHRVALLRSWSNPAGPQVLLAAARRAMRAGLILPLSVFDPSAIGANDAPPSLRGLVLGDSRKDIRSREVALARLGLV